MTEPMTVEQCRAEQRICSTSVHEAIDDLRKEIKDDISKIREAVQNTDRSVAQIKGHLGLNGSGPQPHRRDNEDTPHVHKRAEDTSSGWLKKNWLMIVTIILASFAGERVIPVILKVLGWG